MSEVKPSIKGNLRYDFLEVEDYWPRRLLHIPTMTSVKRHSLDQYMDPDGNLHQQPRYSILTYTWGRFKKDGEASLLVRDTDWNIPSVDPQYFTVEEFTKVVKLRLSIYGIEWAWIDVACIDQREDSQENAEEVGHQASIFSKAATVFVWLWTLSTDTLRSTIRDIQQYSLPLRWYIDGLVLESSPELLEGMSKFRAALSCMFADWWFSSLWTLQEIILRRDAFALSREAELIPWDDEYTTTFAMIVNTCNNVWRDMQAFEEQIDQLELASSHESCNLIMKEIVLIKKMLLSAGFNYLYSSNPNIQYGTAKYRTTLYDEDRIYAIMQVYKLKVGKSARPSEDHPNFAELELEFGAAINNRCPILGQFFTHTVDQVPQRTWCITRDSTVPYNLGSYMGPVPRCSISIAPSGTAVVQGNFCLFEDLIKILSQEASLSDSLNLDQYVHKSKELPKSDPITKRNGAQLAMDLCSLFGRTNLLLLWLGTLTTNLNEAKWRQHRQAGLLISSVNPKTLRGNDGQTYYRCGVYSWIEPGETEDIVNDSLCQLEWKDMELLLN